MNRSILGLLLFLSAITPSLSQPDQQEIYVDVNSQSSNPDGTINNPFNNFRDAVNAVKGTSTIVASPGNYIGADNTNIFINTDVSLSFKVNGNNGGVVIDFQGTESYFLNVTYPKSSISVQGYNFQNQARTGIAPALSFTSTGNTVVDNCYFLNLAAAIVMTNVSDMDVKNSGFQSNYNVYNLETNGPGVNSMNSAGSITNNVFSENESRYGGALFIRFENTLFGNSITLDSNKFINNTASEAGASILLSGVSDTILTIKNCDFQMPTHDAIGAIDIESNSRVIFDNSCNIPGLYLATGVISVCGCGTTAAISNFAIAPTYGSAPSIPLLMSDAGLSLSYFVKWHGGGSIAGVDSTTCLSPNTNINNYNDGDENDITVKLTDEINMSGALTSSNVNWVVDENGDLMFGSGSVNTWDIGDNDITLNSGTIESRAVLNMVGPVPVTITCQNLYNGGFLAMVENCTIHGTVYENNATLSIAYQRPYMDQTNIAFIDQHVVNDFSTLYIDLYPNNDGLHDETFYVLDYNSNKNEFMSFSIDATYRGTATLNYEPQTLTCTISGL